MKKALIVLSMMSAMVFSFTSSAAAKLDQAVTDATPKKSCFVYQRDAKVVMKQRLRGVEYSNAYRLAGDLFAREVVGLAYKSDLSVGKFTGSIKKLCKSRKK